MNKFLFHGFIKVFLIVAVLFFTGCGPEKASQLAEKGILDLSDWDFEKDGKVNLDGEWEFYWQKLLEPAAYSGPETPQKTGYFDVPGYWNQHEVNGKTISGDGYATFRLIIKLKPGQSLAVKTESQATAYRLWVDSELVLYDGLVGKTQQSMRPSSSVKLAPVNSENQTIQIILQVSNYYLNKGGPFHRISIGSEALLRREQTLMWAHNFLLFGGLFVIGIYHLIFYMLRRKDVTPFYFGAVCLLWCFRIPFEGMGGKFITLLFSEFPWIISYKLELLTWYLCIPVFFTFISLLYPMESSGKTLKISWILGLFFIFIALISPAKIASYTVLPYEIISASLGLYGLFIMIRALAHKRQGVIMMITGYSAFLLAGINDILYDNMIIYTGYFIPLGFFIMIMMQSMVLSRRFANSFTAVEKLSNELEEKNIILSHFDKLKDEFLANTSHELRTPLTGIIGIAESIRDRIGKQFSRSDISASLSIIVSSATRLANLINDILDFSRLKNRDIELHKKPVDLRALTDKVMAVSQHLADEKNLEFRNEISEKTALVYGDEDRLQQILYNLIGNAIKFTDQGYVKVSAHENDSMLEITVSDTGIGIPKDRFDKIFQSFEQAGDDRSVSRGGTGLGLSITRHLVELHGGHIRVESETDRGSSFIFTIPTTTLESEMECDSHVIPDRSRLHLPQLYNSGIMPPLFDSTESMSNYEDRNQILVIDDDPLILQIVSNHLSSSDISVIRANNGPEALEKINQNDLPDLVLLDIMMPGMSGFEVCQRFRQQFSSSELPIIMLTARSGMNDLVQGFKLGINDYLIKPFIKDELLARVRSQLKLKHAYSTLRENLSLRKELEQRKQTEQELRLMQQRLSSLLNAVEDPLLAVNESREISFCNRACENLLGYSARELLGQSVLEFIKPEKDNLLINLWEGHFKQCRDTGLSQELGQLCIKRADGAELSSEALMTLLDLEEDHIYLLMITNSPEANQRKQDNRFNTQGLQIIRELNYNMERMRSLEESLGNISPLIREKDPCLIDELDLIENTLARVNQSLTKNLDSSDKYRLALEVMTLTLTYWTEATGSTKIELAVQSRLWKVYTNQDGWQRTQTLDKYLQLQTFPKRPNWRRIIQTADFVLANCDSQSPTREKLDTALARLLMQI